MQQERRDGICWSENPVTGLLGFANGVPGCFLGDHDYDIDPVSLSGSGDIVHDQPSRIPHGPPLPVPAQTPWEKCNGDLPEAQRAGEAFSEALSQKLPPELRDRLREFLWPSAPEDA